MSGPALITVEAEVRVGEVRPLLSRLQPALQRTWEPGRGYTLGTLVRPNLATGFEYEVTNAGQSASEEPLWPVSIGETVQDGSVEWTCRDQANAAVDPIQSSAWSASGGLTISGQATNAIALEATAKISGGNAGATYEVRNTITTVAGLVYVILYRLTYVA